MGYDELKALEGQDIGTSGWMEIDQARINLFADATNDHQWIHVDADKAAAGPFGTTIAHGFLTLALVVPLAGEVELPVEGVRMGINYGVDKVRFTNPVKVGSRIRLHRKVVEVTQANDGGIQVKNLMTIEIEGEARPAAIAETLSRYYF